MVAITQLAITLGATVGGVVLDHCGCKATFELRATLLVVAAALAVQDAHAATQQVYLTSQPPMMGQMKKNGAYVLQPVLHLDYRQH